jgi:carboxymethylenebutenolidase
MNMEQDVIEVATQDGSMPAYISLPDGPGPFPLVVVYMDAPGVREDLHGATRRLNDAGYITALPDLYYRLDAGARPKPERLGSGDQQEFERMAAAAQSLGDADVLADTHAVLHLLGSDRRVDLEHWGCVGFCMGGRFGLRAAAEFGDAMVAGALLHPSQLVTDAAESPHRSLDRVRGELYLGFGENDHVTPLSTIPPLREELERNHVRYKIDVFPDADHGFTQPSGPAYNREAAEGA